MLEVKVQTWPDGASYTGQWVKDRLGRPRHETPRRTKRKAWVDFSMQLVIGRGLKLNHAWSLHFSHDQV